jgi:hypothetical protein
MVVLYNVSLIFLTIMRTSCDSGSSYREVEIEDINQTDITGDRNI